MNEAGKFLVLAGLVLVVVGLLLWSGVGKGWLGQLPGDLHFRNSKGNFSFHFPLVTCLLLSVVVSVLLWFFRR